jgi:hypothetical protein
MKDHFDGIVEVREKPSAVSVEDQLCRAREYQAWRDAGNRVGASGDPSKVHGVKRVSILNGCPIGRYVTVFATPVSVPTNSDP